MSKSVIYSANTNSQSVVATGSVINFGSIVRRYGQNLNLSGGNVVTSGIGYYNVDVNVSFTVASGTTATIQIFKDGVAVEGAEAILTTGTNTYQATIPCLIRNNCCCESIITVVISGVGATVINASIVVEKE